MMESERKISPCHGKTALQWSGQYSFICASPVTDACANLPVD
jgi:hypothetical protein